MSSNLGDMQVAALHECVVENQELTSSNFETLDYKLKKHVELPFMGGELGRNLTCAKNLAKVLSIGKRSLNAHGTVADWMDRLIQ